jgi:hypothetical protein
MPKSLLACLMLSLLVGCGPAGPETKPTVPVEGKVTYNGKPVANAVVSFSPLKTEKGHYAAMGITNAEGVYSLHTPFGGTTDNPGAVEDDYSVSIIKSKTEGLTPSSSEAPSTENMAKMMSGNQNRNSGSSRPMMGPPRGGSSSSGRMNQNDSEIPVRYALPGESPLKVTVPGGKYDFDLTDK